MASNDENQAKYFIRVRGRVLGPYTVSQLATLRSRGQFGRANEVSTDGQSWESAATIESLFEGTGSKKARGSKETGLTTTQKSSGPPSRAMAPIWYYSIGEEQCGPVTLIELRGMIGSNQLVQDDLVWKEGLSDWMSIRDVPELNAIARTNGAAATAVTTPATPLAQNFCYACGSPTDARAEVCPKCGVRQQAAGSRKDRITAALLAFFLGGIGVHHFYLGNTFRGVIYLLFCWTFIPGIIALVEFIMLLCMSDATFQQKYQKQ